MTKTEKKQSKWNRFWERNKASEGYLLKKVAGNVSYRIVRMLMLFGMCFLILQFYQRSLVRVHSFIYQRLMTRFDYK